MRKTLNENKCTEYMITTFRELFPQDVALKEYNTRILQFQQTKTSA